MLREFLLTQKRDPEQEYTLHLFEYCNLRCGFCWQDHENRSGLDTVVEKLATVKEWLKSETAHDVVFNIMGGEVFAPDIFDESMLHAYKTLSKGIRDMCADRGIRCTINWVTNLVTYKYDMIDDLMQFSADNDIPAHIVTSYDPRGRFNVNDFMQFKKSMEYFGDRVKCVSVLLSVPNIEYLLHKHDPYFQWMYDSGKYIYLDYYMPDTTAHIQAPTAQQMYDIFVFMINNYPNIDPIASWINSDDNYMTCRTSKLVLADGQRCNCGNLVQDEHSIKFYASKILPSDNSIVENNFLMKYNCASCEYFRRCGLGCFMQHDYRFREELDECVYKLTHRYIDNVRVQRRPDTAGSCVT